jgi:hypothetical protein
MHADDRGQEAIQLRNIEHTFVAIVHFDVARKSVRSGMEAFGVRKSHFGKVTERPADTQVRILSRVDHNQLFNIMRFRGNVR